MSTDAALQLWFKQVEMEESNLFILPDSGESACYTDIAKQDLLEETDAAWDWYRRSWI